MCDFILFELITMVRTNNNLYVESSLFLGGHSQGLARSTRLCEWETKVKLVKKGGGEVLLNRIVKG